MSKPLKAAIYSILAICTLFMAAGITGYNIKCTGDPDWGPYTEFLVNYQGGFVRRGLMGEILYQICAPIGLDPQYLIVPFSVVTIVLFLFLLVKAFRNEHLCLWILPVVCGGAGYIRKDFFLLLLVYLILRQIPKLLDGQRKSVFICIILSLIALNAHEASFFIFVPILTLYVLFGHPNKGSVLGRPSVILAPLAMMAALCIYKGDIECARAVSRSWLFAYPDTQPVHACYTSAVGALACETMPAIRFHLGMNFASGPVFAQSAIFIRLFALLAILYVMVQIPFIYLRNREDYRRNTGKLVNFTLFQALSLLPMFTILSCDFCRIIFYWTASSLLAYFCLKDTGLKLPCQERLERLAGPVHRLLSAPARAIFPFILLVLLSIAFCGNNMRKCPYWDLSNIPLKVRQLMY